MAWRERKVRLLSKPHISMDVKLIDKRNNIYALFYHINSCKQTVAVSSGKVGRDWLNKVRSLLLKDPEWKKAILYDIKQSALHRRKNVRDNLRRWGVKYEIYKVKKSDTNKSKRRNVK